MAWLAGWKYRKKHDINGSTVGSVSGYQIKIVVHYGSGADSDENVYLDGSCKNDFGDVRFTADDGVTELPYWMEEKVDGDYAIFWVKIPNIPASPDIASIYVYFGNPEAVYEGSGSEVFEFFDDFEDGVLNTNKWTVLAGTWDEKVGYLETAAGDTVHIIRSTYSGDNYAIETRVRPVSGTYRTGGAASRIQDVDNYYRHYLKDAADQIELRKILAGDDYTLETAAKTISTNVWYRVTGTVYGTTLRLTVNGTAISATDESFASGYAGLYGHGTMDYDFFAVRKYVEPEPSHGTWYAAEAYQEVSETVSIADLKLAQPRLPKTESLAISDVYTRVWSICREQTEELAVTDVFSRVLEVYRTLSETTSLTDTISALKLYLKFLEEALVLTDKTIKSISAVKTESMSLAEVFGKIWSIYRICSETLSLIDKTLKSPSTIKAEIIGTSDLLSKAPLLTRKELVLLEDKITRLWTLIRELTETLTTSDILTKHISTSKQELLQLSDLVRKQPQIPLTELQSLIDSILKAIWKMLVVEEFPIVYRPYVSREMVKRAIIRGNRYQREIIPAN